MLIATSLSLLGVCAQGRDATLVETGVPVSPNSLYVTVALDAKANDHLDLPFTTNQISVNRIPFAVPEARAGNHLFMKDIGWANWQKDPSTFYSPYDSYPIVPDKTRAIVHVPVADYSGVYLLAACDDDPAVANVVSLRIGAVDGRNRTEYHDVTAMVPRFSDETSRLPALPVPGGRLFLVHVPLPEAIAQDFRDRQMLDVDITKSLRLAIRRPDPCRYQLRPLGLPSGVRIFGMTFQRAQIQMELTSEAVGHVFNQPDVPTFKVKLQRDPRWVRVIDLRATATDYYGGIHETLVTNLFFDRQGIAEIALPVPVPKRGYHELKIDVMLNRRAYLSRRTTFALLPSDTRRHRDRSPFGTWDFCGGHFTPDDADRVGPLYVKAGLRYGMFNFSEVERARYGVLPGADFKPTPAMVTNLTDWLKGADRFPPERLMIFHETAISGAHVTRTPDLFSGRSAYVFDEKEQAKFTNLWQTAMETSTQIRQLYPDTEIYFGNGAPHLLEAFLQRKFPAELLGSRGNEAGNFMRMPETQPLDFVANNAGLWMDRTLLDHYGYTNTPLRQCYEMCYPSTNPGNLSLKTQAEQFVRHMMHSLAWRIPIIRGGCITDVGNSYYFSNWGASGLCYGRPHVRPKPSYVATATMTLMLDGAVFDHVVPTGSPVVYAMQFSRPVGDYVTCLWTLRGTRELTATGVLGDASAMDLMGNATPLTDEGGQTCITVSSAPLFLQTKGTIVSIELGVPRMVGRPDGRTFLISALDTLGDWTVETDRSLELETYNFAEPRRQGDFAYNETLCFEGESNVLRVASPPTEEPSYLQAYSVLRHKNGVKIPRKPTEIGLMVNGNGGWGHIYFELEDASGQRWISLGAEQSGEPTRWLQDALGKEGYDDLKSANASDWNTDDPWQRSAINFEGWRYLRFPLPGQYPGEQYHWPYSSQWRYSGDGVVTYPLTFKKLVVTMPQRVLYLTQYEPVPRQDVYLKELMVTYDSPETAFVAP